MNERARGLIRGALLEIVGRLPRHPPLSTVRFFYGHQMEKQDATSFRRILKMLRRHFEFVTMQEAVALVRADRPPAGRFAAFSFDDGFRDNYEYVAPILDEYGARACFFVATNFIECDETYRLHFLRERVHQPASKQPMTWDMLRELATAGFTVGAHTVDHRNLSELDTQNAVRQVLESKRAVEEKLGRPCDYFAWPYGLTQHFPAALLPSLRPHFDSIFSAIRSRQAFSYDGLVINRGHFEPYWPAHHVRFFSTQRIEIPHLVARPDLSTSA